MRLFSKEDVLNEYPLRIQFADELGYDTGGLCCDMFLAYWEEAYKSFFDGILLLTPVVHPHVDMSTMPLKVMSHGYLVCGFLLTRVTFPALASILLDLAVEIPAKILVETFADSLNYFEASIIKEALTVKTSTFSDRQQSQLLSVLSRCGCRVCPTPQDLSNQLSCIAKYEFQTKPMAAFYTIASGIPSKEKPFWKSYSVEDLYTLYIVLTATPSKVLLILEEPDIVDSCQERVYGYLQQYIGNLRREDVPQFLRFTNGSSVVL